MPMPRWLRRLLPGSSCDGETLAKQLEQTAGLTDIPVKTALVDPGYLRREVDGVRILDRGKPKRMSKSENGYSSAARR